MGAWNLIGFTSPGSFKSASPLPVNFSAPFLSSTTIELLTVAVFRAIRQEMFALIRLGSSYSVTKAKLYSAYASYCTKSQIIPEKKAEVWAFFEEQMDNLKIKKSKHLGENRGSEGYTGMTLKSTAAVFDLLNSE